MKTFFLAVLVLIALLAGVVLVAPALIPVDAYKGRLETAASNALGRQVSFGDDIRFRLFPTTAFRVGDLVIANAPGFEADHLARVRQADIGVKLIPLFSQRVEVERFVLIEPDIRLERAADGSVNWNLAKTETQAETGEPGRIEELRLGDVRIEGGRASYSDRAADSAYEATDIDLAVHLERLAEPLEARGTFAFEGAPARIDLVLTTLDDVLADREANLKFELALGEAKAAADLAVRAGDALAYSGPVSLDAPDLRAFAALLGAPLAEGPGFDRLSVEGAAEGGDSAVRLSDARVGFDAIDAEGDLALNWSGDRPKATGRLAATTLDLRPYLPPPAESAEGFPAWSEERFDFSSLRNLDAELELAAERIYLNDLELGESRMMLAIENGRLVADIPRLALYGGAGSGRLVVNAHGQKPSFEGAFDLGSVNAQPFAVDALKTDRLLGVGGLRLEFSAEGASQAEIMRTVDGTGSFDIADGALKGINLAGLARSVADMRQTGFNPAAIASAVAAAQNPAEETDFTSFLSQFSMTDGAVSASRISLAGPFVSMTGAGSVNLPQQTIDLRLAPRAAAEADVESAQSISIPLRVTGTFSEPRVVVDVETLVRGGAEEAVRGLIDRLRPEHRQPREGEDAQEGAQGQGAGQRILDSVLGGGRERAPEDDAASPEGGSASSRQNSPALDAIDRIFRRPAPQTGTEAEEEESAEQDEPQ